MNCMYTTLHYNVHKHLHYTVLSAGAIGQRDPHAGSLWCVFIRVLSGRQRL